MSGNYVQFNRRSLISILLAVLMLTLAATPALAYLDEGDTNGQPAMPCRVISDGQDGHTVVCIKVTRHHQAPVVAEKSLLHPAVARAEQMSVAGPELVAASAQ